MNTTVIAYGSKRSMARVGNPSAITMGRLWPLFLMILLTLFAIVYFKDYNRRLFNQTQAMNQQFSAAHVMRGRYLLEQSTLAAQSRVQEIAQNKLGMILPSARDTVMLQVPARQASAN
jgi:cell division protein FtsL